MEIWLHHSEKNKKWQTNQQIVTYQSMCLKFCPGMSMMVWWRGMTQGKCTDVLEETNNHFREAKIINFDIIHRQYQGEVVPPDLLKYYQTINKNTVSGYPSSEQTEIRSSAFRADRKDIFFENETIKKKIKKIGNKKSKVLLCQSSF